MGKFIDLTNKKINKLTVQYRDNSVPKGKPPKWICNCDCGKQNLSIFGMHLRTGHTKSCGCYNLEQIKIRSTIHGMTKTPEHKTWSEMRQRCYNPNNNQFNDWGGRGIAVCDRWKDSFQNFYEDMGPRPSDKYSIDRIDNNGNYQPSNCKWSSRKDQARNTRKNVIESLEQAEEIRTKYKTGKYTQQELADSYKCNQTTISLITLNKIWIKI